MNLLVDDSPTIHSIAIILGTFCSSFPGVEFGKLHYRGLENLKIESLLLHRSHFESVTSLTDDAREDVIWKKENVLSSFGFISHSKPSVFLSTDASKLGWRADIEEPGITPVGGCLTPEESRLHINYLELMAAFFGLKSFYMDLKATHIRLKVDNTTVVAYINAFGGIRSELCNSVAKQLWEWCIDRNLWVSTCDIAGALNVDFDTIYAFHPFSLVGLCLQKLQD